MATLQRRFIQIILGFIRVSADSLQKKKSKIVRGVARNTAESQNNKVQFSSASQDGHFLLVLLFVLITVLGESKNTEKQLNSSF